jgi:hypothetical protein
MAQQPVPENVSILHELDLGQHTLFIRSDGSIDLLANDEEVFNCFQKCIQMYSF